MSKMKGIKCKLEIVDSNDTSKILAGQRSATLNRSVETMDSTSKDSEWKENEVGLKEWSMDADGVLVASDEVYEDLEEKWLNSEKIDVRITMPSGTKYQGRAILTDFPIDMPYDDLVTYSLSLTGDGPLVKTP
ncbi:phage tail tube protein [Sutcliffiella halmapala]|uniref:phage tail tube protein n=1 Tax=Sutcliffiella halmapala TaxID=79882 RepID=UPI000994B840|nr:phage major tail protein, TP901-1 family [Sutcliffiella halmapala]